MNIISTYNRFRNTLHVKLMEWVAFKLPQRETIIQIKIPIYSTVFDVLITILYMNHCHRFFLLVVLLLSARRQIQ